MGPKGRSHLIADLLVGEESPISFALRAAKPSCLICNLGPQFWPVRSHRTATRGRGRRIGAACRNSWYPRVVQQQQPDPFFEQLEADLREGVEAAERGELISADAVWARLYARVDDIERSQPPQ
jgi:hypothetical protein